MRNNNWSIVLVVLVCLGCGRSTPADKLCGFITEKRPTGSCGSLSAVIHLTERGCMPCVREFALIAEDHQADDDVLFIVSAMGTKIDISPFLADSSRVIWDFSGAFGQLGVLERTGIIFLDHGRLDTILTIEANVINEQLEYISTRLKQH